MKTDPYSLDRLADVVTPEPVLWWPPAPGWYFLIAIAAVWLYAGIIKAFVRWRRNAYRRQALTELRELSAGDFCGLSTLLKRVALVAFPRHQVASLAGQKWTTFLTTTCVGADFESTPACRIGTASYEPSPSPDGIDQVSPDQWNQITQLATTWISGHNGERLQ